MTESDQFKPVFTESTYSGYIQNTTADVVFVTEEDGVTKLKVQATDADDADVIC